MRQLIVRSSKVWHMQTKPADTRRFSHRYLRSVEKLVDREDGFLNSLLLHSFSNELLQRQNI